LAALAGPLGLGQLASKILELPLVLAEITQALFRRERLVSLLQTLAQICVKA